MIKSYIRGNNRRSFFFYSTVLMIGVGAILLSQVSSTDRSLDQIVNDINNKAGLPVACLYHSGRSTYIDVCGRNQ